jgi:hypothetical protein
MLKSIFNITLFILKVCRLCVSEKPKAPVSAEKGWLLLANW